MHDATRTDTGLLVDVRGGHLATWVLRALFFAVMCAVYVCIESGVGFLFHGTGGVVTGRLFAVSILGGLLLLVLVPWRRSVHLVTAGTEGPIRVLADGWLWPGRIEVGEQRVPNVQLSREEAGWLTRALEARAKGLMVEPFRTNLSPNEPICPGTRTISRVPSKAPLSWWIGVVVCLLLGLTVSMLWFPIAGAVLLLPMLLGVAVKSMQQRTLTLHLRQQAVSVELGRRRATIAYDDLSVARPSWFYPGLVLELHDGTVHGFPLARHDHSERLAQAVRDAAEAYRAGSAARAEEEDRGARAMVQQLAATRTARQRASARGSTVPKGPDRD